MGLKDRLKGKKKSTPKEDKVEKTEKLNKRRSASKNRQAESSLNTCEFCEIKLSIDKLTSAVNQAGNISEIGAIAQEFSKFLSSLSANDATITFSGSFDLGQRTLLNCFLEKFKYEETCVPTKAKIKTVEEDEQEQEEHEEKTTKKRPAAKQMTKRKSLKQRLAEQLEQNEEEQEKEEQEEQEEIL